MNKKIILALFYSSLILNLIQCSEPAGLSESESSGEELAKAMCSSCHSFPDPKLLDKASWEKVVLPRMGYFLGIYESPNNRAELIENGSAEAKVLAQNIFPEKRIVDSLSWYKIQEFYLSNSPESLVQSKLEIAQKTKQFRAIRPAFKLSPPSVTALKITDNNVLIGDVFTGALHVLEHSLRSLGATKTKESPVWITEHNDHYLITIIGSFSPTDAPNGSLIYLPKSTKEQSKVLLQNLQRPVHHALADFNNDGLDDIVVCEFAKWTGSLSLFINLGDGSYQKQIVKALTGSLKAFPRDWNGDGLMDLVALFGQGDEGIRLFLNKGNANFLESNLKRFPPSYGSSFMALQDLNNDGNEDIVYCAGDNADFGPILRPYHGIYLYFNTGNNLFNDSIFIPLNGAYAAIPRDFDQDGDLDIAAISFFPDFESQPEEGFVYLENNGKWSFSASSIAEVSSGRWIVMDDGDLDQDGDIDLAIGSLAFEVPGNDSLVKMWIKNAIPFIVLENLKN